MRGAALAAGRHLVSAACPVVFGGLQRDGTAASPPEAGSVAEVVGATVLGSPWAVQVTIARGQGTIEPPGQPPADPPARPNPSKDGECPTPWPEKESERCERAPRYLSRARARAHTHARMHARTFARVPST